MTSWFEREPLSIHGLNLTARQVIQTLEPQLTEERREKLHRVVSRRSDQVVAVLENIYDRGNISAVMRSAEAFGFYDFRIVENPNERFKPANRVTAGTEKWLKISKYRTTEDVVASLRQKDFQIFVTHLGPDSVRIEDVDFTRPTAFFLGNEKDGVSEAARHLADGSFVIPMQGMAQSFNISVAGALCFYHALSRRRELLKDEAFLSPGARELLLANYILRSVAHGEEILERQFRGAPQ